MGSRIGKGKHKGSVGKEIQTVATMVRRLLPRGLDQSYGAMATIMKYLPWLEQLRLQGLDKWWYIIGVSRVQSYIEWPEVFYFAHRTQIVAVAEKGEQRWLVRCRDPDFSDGEWISCQVGRSYLFQCKKDSFRIIKIDPFQRSFTVERQSALPQENPVLYLTNFQDQFIFLFRVNRPRQYSLTEDSWEELPSHRNSLTVSACSLEGKVYVFAYRAGKNLIHVLHNPGASISSQELHWQVIEVPETISRLRQLGVGFVPLGSTEIAILGGAELSGRILGDVITFNTSTCEFKKELDDEENPFLCQKNMSANVCKDTIIAVVTDYNNENCLAKYTKGDICLTTLNSDVFE